MTIRALIVDDEAIARRRLVRLLQPHLDVEVVGQCADGRSAVDAIDHLRPAIVFLDVQMPELDGFDVLQALDHSAAPAIIFVTAFDQYAVRAFDVHAVDYLLKPVAADRLLDALRRIRARLQHPAQPTSPLRVLRRELMDDRRFVRRLPVRQDDRIVVVELSEVDWIGAADNYVALHAGAREWLVRGSLATLERDLDPEMFVRIHRSTIVRVDRIREIVPESHGDATLVLKNGLQLEASRNYRRQVERAISGRSPFAD